MDNINDIFGTISSHMLEGIMMHDQLYRFFLFLRLNKFAKKQEDQYKDESKEYHKINKYFITHKNRLIKWIPIEISEYIPREWYESNRRDITPKDVREGTIFALSSWISWEEESLELYKRCYTDALNLGNVEDLTILQDLVDDVSKELKEANELRILLSGMNFDPIEILELNK